MVKFTARRSLPELVAPARPTPRETKVLSNVDDCYDLRVYSFGVEFFRYRPGGHPTTTPAKAVKVALVEALVYYYPMAGRLREILPTNKRILPTNKLVVDCTGEGVVFVEALADVGLEEFGNPSPHPPYPCIEELLCDTGDIKVVVDKPLFFVQHVCKEEGHAKSCHITVVNLPPVQVKVDVARIGLCGLLANMVVPCPLNL
ncbi:acyl transferase 1-like [Triticum dicoccoides]|uniref:acyl transferase 1-like n=1 Tax=Triticum dicoccoides TaxID=85692 RepID=UPI0018917478|nr:acyl transferase 1-like [Triticum dicoccoides]